MRGVLRYYAIGHSKNVILSQTCGRLLRLCKLSQYSYNSQQMDHSFQMVDYQVKIQPHHPHLMRPAESLES